MNEDGLCSPELSFLPSLFYMRFLGGKRPSFLSEFACLEFFFAIAIGDEDVVSRFIRNHPERWKEAANEVRFLLSVSTANLFLLSDAAGI